MKLQVHPINWMNLPELMVGSKGDARDAAQVRMSIESATNDDVKPVPRSSVECWEMSRLPVGAIAVIEGRDKPYLYRGKAYRRSDTVDVLRTLGLYSAVSVCINAAIIPADEP